MQTEIPTIPGTEFGGGFYAGRFFIGNDTYALIVAPKVLGETEKMPWNNSYDTVTGALSYADGLANTRAMAEAGSELAKKILDLRIGGFDDWHLPSHLQQLVSFYELQSAAAFARGGLEAFERDWYWSSTQHATHADWAWMQFFGYGYQDNLRKGYDYRARAVRRIKI